MKGQLDKSIPGITEMKLRVTRDVARQIYSNHEKGNIPLKPWKGQGGCTWLAFDGTPYAGQLEGKDIEVVVSVRIPAGIEIIRGPDLLQMFSKQGGGEGIPDKTAERRMWDDVSNRCLEQANGCLIVEVGRTRFSSTPGKFFLVANAGMKNITLTDAGLNTLLEKLEPDDIAEVVRKANDKHDKNDEVSIVIEGNGTEKAGESYLKSFLAALASDINFDKSGVTQSRQRVVKHKTMEKWKITIQYRLVKPSAAKQMARAVHPILRRFALGGASAKTVLWGTKRFPREGGQYKQGHGVHEPPYGESLRRSK